MAYKHTRLEITENGNRKYRFSTENFSQEELKGLLNYNPETGIFTWKNPPSNTVKRDQIAGCVHIHGYRLIRVRGVLHRASRLAWFYSYGQWPVEIDHKDRDKSNDRLANLREATSQQNKTNRSAYNKLGVKGVQKNGSKYAAYITINYTSVYLGTFDTKEEAGEAYKQAAKKVFGEFARG